MFDQFLPDLNWLDRKCLCIGVFLQLKYPARVDSLVLVNPTSTRPGWIEWGYQKVRAHINNCFTYRRGGGIRDALEIRSTKNHFPWDFNRIL